MCGEIRGVPTGTGYSTDGNKLFPRTLILERQKLSRQWGKGWEEEVRKRNWLYLGGQAVIGLGLHVRDVPQTRTAAKFVVNILPNAMLISRS